MSSHNNIGCVLRVLWVLRVQSVLPVGHCLVYPPSARSRWALKPEFQLWAKREYLTDTQTHTHEHILPHLPPPFGCACVCALGIFQNGKQSARDRKKRPANRSLSLRKTQNPFPPLTHTHTGTLSFCFTVCVCVCICVWGRQFAKHLLNLISPARSILDFSPPLSPLFTFHFELPG